MRRFVTVLVMAMIAIGCAPQAFAQEVHAVPQAALDAALQQHAAASAADRDAILRVLDHSEVKAIAARMGIDLRRATSAIATMDQAQLAALSAQAQRVDQSLAGGASSVTISTTTIIIGLLVLILIIVAVR
jgi:hypothetical protein